MSERGYIFLQLVGYKLNDWLTHHCAGFYSWFNRSFKSRAVAALTYWLTNVDHLLEHA